MNRIKKVAYNTEKNVRPNASKVTMHIKFRTLLHDHKYIDTLYVRGQRPGEKNHSIYVEQELHD